MARKALVVLDERWNSALTDLGLKIARSLSCRVTVAALKGYPAFSRAAELGLETLPIEDPRRGLPLKAFLSFKRAVEAVKPQVVVTIRGDEMLFAALLKKRYGYNLFRVHGHAKGIRNTLLNRFIHKRFVNGVVVSSRRLLNDVVAPLEKLLIPGIVDTSLFSFSQEARHRWRRRLGVPAELPLIGVVARFDPVKGHDLLFKALHAVKNQRWKLVVVGREEGVSLRQLKELAASLGILERIAFFTDRVADLPGLLSACDIGVVPSKGSEVVLRAPLEFMACRTCLVATAVGALPEVIAPPWGRLVKPSADGIALGLSSLLKLGAERLLELGKAAQEVAREKYSFEALSPRIDRFICSGVRNGQ
jgi:glycosyltransferase involved in cell wall biosynthesis